MNGTIGVQERTRAAPHRPPASLAAIARQRRDPAFYIVDGDLRVRAASAALDEVTLPADVLAATRALLARRGGAAPLVALLASGAIVRVVPTIGEEPRFVVFVTAARDPLARAVERYGFTHREADVLEALLQGASTSAIAATLSISKLTVLQHVKNVGRKIGVSKRKEIVAALTGAH